MSVKIEISLELIARENNPGEFDMVTCEPMGGMKYNYYFACFSKIGVISRLDILNLIYQPRLSARLIYDLECLDVIYNPYF